MSKRKAGRAALLLESGLRQFQQGQLEQARRAFEQALEIAPRNPDALHLLGVTALQNGDHAAAVEMLQRAVAIRPDDPAYHCNLAYGYVGLERMPEALAAFEHAARLNSNDPDLQMGIGNCLAMMGKAAEAEAVLRRLVGRLPEHPLAWFNLANTVKDQERYEEARDLYLRVTQLAPQFAEAHCNLGVALQKLDRFDEAEQAYRACLARNPGFMPARVGLASTLNTLRRYAEAEALCREVLAREPGHENAWLVLGRALTGQGRWSEGLRCCEQAIKEFPESSDAFGDLGHVLACLGRTGEALAAFDRAYAPGNVSSFVHFSKAIALFAVGRIAEGAAEHMDGIAHATFVEQHPEMPLARELPADLLGREVGLIGVQGIGDEIFFLRYAPRLKARGCRISYCGSAKITGILARSAVFEHTTSNLGPLAAAHYRILVGDLPHLLVGAEASPSVLPAESPRRQAGASGLGARMPWHCRVHWPELPPPLALEPLAARVSVVARRLHELGPPPYVGLTWRAGTDPREQRGHVRLLFKEIPLEELAAALRSVRGTLLSLQRGPRAGETEKLAALTGRPVHDLSAANEDLEEMLTLLAVLDEYVGVSSTNMHLRASAGRTARVLVPWPGMALVGLWG